MAVVLVAVMGLGVAVWAMTSTPKTTGASVWTAEPTARATTAPAVTPTATPSPAKVGNCSGSSAETPDWRALIPSGWTCTYEAGNEVTIVNDANDAIMVRATGTPERHGRVQHRSGPFSHGDGSPRWHLGWEGLQDD